MTKFKMRELKTPLIALITVFFLLTGASASYCAIDSQKAWEDYNAGRMEKAFEGFDELHRIDPKNADFALGLAYSALKTGRVDLALEIALSFEGSKADFRNIKMSIYSMKANDAYEAKNYEDSARYFKIVYKERPDDNGVKILLAWSLFHTKDFDGALKLFKEMYAASKDKALEETIITIYKRKGSPRGAAEFAKTLPGADSARKKLVAQFAQKSSCPVLAAEVYNSSDVCWYNADKPDITFGSSIRSKTGDKGSSYLVDVNSPLTVSYPFSSGNVFLLTARSDFLYTGKPDKAVFAGSAYRGSVLLQGPVNNLPTSLMVWSVGAGLKREGAVRYSLNAGLSPVGGPISAAPTFEAAVDGSSWHMGAHQEPVAESILSFTGLKDPYGDQAWGRVSKRGLEGLYTLGLMDYWLSLKAGYDEYSGVNVIKNSATSATVTFGRTEAIENPDGDYELNAGIFASYVSFRKNTAYYTFGHGGYFSPQRFYVAGPIVSFQTRHCDTHWLTGSITVNYSYFVNDPVAQFPLSPSDLPASAIVDYGGSTTKGIGYAASVEERRILSPRWAASVAVKYDRSAEYTEWKAGFDLTYSFEPRSAVKLD